MTIISCVESRSQPGRSESFPGILKTRSKKGLSALPVTMEEGLRLRSSPFASHKEKPGLPSPEDQKGQGERGRKSARVFLQALCVPDQPPCNCVATVAQSSLVKFLSLATDKVLTHAGEVCEM